MRSCAYRRAQQCGAASIKSLLAVLAFIAVAAAIFLFLFGQVIQPGNIGIRQIAFGPYKGFSERALRPGYHWVVPFYSRIYLVPQTVQVIDFHRENSGGSFEPLEVPTADRAMVNVDVSVLVRFDASNKVFSLGVEPSAWEQAIRVAARTALRQSLSKLDTAGFYSPEKREANLADATAIMKAELAPRGVEVQGVLLRRYTYEASFEDSIFRKNLEELKREISVKEAEYAKAEGAVENVKSDFNGKMAATKEKGETGAAIIRSDGELYDAQQRAQGDLLVATAKAAVDAQRAGALARAQTANVYVARELAPLLGSLKGGVISGMDPYDLDAWVSRLGIKEGK